MAADALKGADDLPRASASTLAQAIRSKQLSAVEAVTARFMADYDALISPVAAWPAPLHGESFAGAGLHGFGYSMMHNLTGYPSAAVRAGTAPNGLPIGI
jgi:amidase